MLLSTWYIPVVPVRNKDSVRLVFDGSAEFKGISLNNSLLSGSDFTNRLKGVLLRFRLKQIGFSADIKSTFHCFHLQPQDRDLTRFYWFSKNDPNLPLTQFRAKVHIIGSTSSPSLAAVGLLYAASQS